METRLSWLAILTVGCAAVGVFLLAAFFVLWLLIHKKSTPRGFPVEAGTKPPGD
jgi:hypothetical protein